MMQFVEAIALGISFFASAWLWFRIARSHDPFLMKAAHCLLVAIPMIGPLLWLFLDVPDRRADGGEPTGFRFNGPIYPRPTEPKLSVIVWWIITIVGGAFSLCVHAYLIAFIFR